MNETSQPAQQHPGSAYPASSSVYASIPQQQVGGGAPDDMSNAAARLANLQLASSSSAGVAYSQAYSQAGAGGMTGADHLTPVPTPAAASSPPPQMHPAAPLSVSPVAGSSQMAHAPASSAPDNSANRNYQQQQPPPAGGNGGSFAPGYGPQNSSAYAFNSVSQAQHYQQQQPPPQIQQQQQQQQQQQPMRQSMDGAAQQYHQQQQQQQQPMLPPIIGPMVQFVNVELERALWHGSVLVLTNESLLPQGSRAAPPPSSQAQAGTTSGGPTASGPAYSSATSGSAMHAGPTPVASAVQSPNMHIPVIEVWDDGVHGPGTGKPKTFQAKAIYTEPTYKYTFWRADVTLPLPQENEVDVMYQVYWGADEHAVQSYSARQTYSFRLAAQASQWRMCVTSNNQFSRRVPDAARSQMRGSGPVLRDLLAKHKANPFHLWIGAGGQFNGEGVWDDCEHVLRPFLLPGTDHSRRAHVQWTADMASAIDRWYFLEYLRQWFGIGATSHPLDLEGQSCFRQAVETIPYSFTPDTEIFPGFGSHSNSLQFTPVFNGLRHTGAKYYALFQAHTTPTLAHNEHGFLAEGYHTIKKVGPYTAILTLDTRTERQLAGVIDRHSYDMLFNELEARVPPTTTNLIVVTSNPVIFPRTKNFESILRGASTTGLTQIISYAVNNGKKMRNDWITQDRFGEPLAVTMLNDFWTSAVHKSERAFLVHSLQEFSRRRSCRVTFTSGHVNCLAASHLRTYTDSRFDPRKYPEQRGFVSDFRSMIQLTVSGIVQEPADNLTLRAYHFAGKSAPFDMFTEEKLYHTFTFDVNHLPPPNNNQKLLGRRSYGIIIEHDFDNDRQRPGLLSFFYVENETFTGTATPYIINIPPLRYPQLPTAGGSNNLPPQSSAAGAKPQMRQSVTYRSYTAPSSSDAPVTPMASASHGMQTKGDPYDGNPDPYSYDVPGYEANQLPSSMSQGNNAAVSAPPPYSPVPQQQATAVPVSGSAGLPMRTEGTYSSSYEHTAAWVQGSASQTTGSDTAGPTHFNTHTPLGQQQQLAQQQPVQQQPMQYTQQTVPYSQPPPPVNQAPQQQQQQQQQQGMPPPSSSYQQQQQFH
ncbi:hypothetical protein LPJ74_004716 [Coemansia sp. RSA 1843]|nr:hypothetical protein LPJ74_004716 [Coemansia sp. RSA 1843]